MNKTNVEVRCELWNQSKNILRQEALKARHPRTRERLMALYIQKTPSINSSVANKLLMPNNFY